MQLTNFLFLSTMVSTTVLASDVLVRNYCTSSYWLTVTRANQQTTGPFELHTLEAYTEPIEGVGNSLGVTESSQYWSKDEPKLVLGYSTSQETIYWSVMSVDGNPFGAGSNKEFNITSTKGCGGEDTTNGPVHTCKDDEVELTLNLCAHNV